MKATLTEFFKTAWGYAQEAWAFTQAAATKLADMWALKAALGVFAKAAIWLIKLKHVQVLGVFTFLVVLDVATKYAALSYQRLIDNGEQDPPVLRKWQAIPLAFDDKYIRSRYGRESFRVKILTYVEATLAAYLFDLMAGTPGWAVHLVWLYLGGNEFLSILENLRDGGNKAMGHFLELVRDKLETRVRK